MDKRTLLAVSLCMVVVILWPYAMKLMFPGLQTAHAGAPGAPGAPGSVTPTAEPAAPTPTAVTGDAAGAPTETATPPAAPERASAPPAPAAPATSYPVKPILLANDRVRATFTTKGAALESLVLLPVKVQDMEIKNELELLQPAGVNGGPFPALEVEAPVGETLTAAWDVTETATPTPAGPAPTAIFTLPLASGAVITKRVTLPPAAYAFDVAVHISAPRADAMPAGYALHAETGMTPEDEGRTSIPADEGVQGTIYGVAGVRKEGDRVDPFADFAGSIPATGKEWKENTFYGGAASKYFALVLAPETHVIERATLYVETYKLKIGFGRDDVANLRSGYRVDLPRPRGAGAAPVESEQRFTFFAGPKMDVVLARYREHHLDALLDFHSRWPGAETLSNVFLAILRAIHSIGVSFGLAVMVLTLMVRALLHPLTRLSQRSMQKMQKLAPKVKEIQERHKGRKDAQQKVGLETMELYRKHGVSPLYGCLPTLFQFPVFVGLYNALAYSIELRQTRFLWIHDLTRPDRLFCMGRNTLPSLPLGFFGDYFNLLPVLTVAAMVVQQSLQPPPPDPQQAEQAKMMKWVMVIFGAMFYHVASGLVLYFLASALFGMLEQRIIKRQLAREDAAFVA